ncbi:MAG: chloride channel protein [Zoogloeaceae bacterium]|jgi:H+/Cl- antiporter ClcA|nr:chloride channel protein [Zoogloeaceae bacterium]
MNLRTFLRRRAVDSRIWLGRLVFWGGAVGVGLLAVLFAELSSGMTHYFMRAARQFWWLPFIVTPLGGVLCVWLTRRYFAGAEGSGIPQTLVEIQRAQTVGHVKEKSAWRPLLSIRIIFGKILVGAGAVGCGFSLGREGPTVQVGASLMNAIHHLLPAALRIQRVHLLVAGGAAGIAAAFNAPLAGVMFAIEEMIRGVEARMSGLIITAIVLAGVTAQAMKGSGGNYFGAVPIIAGEGDQLAAAALAALTCGLLGGLFSRMMIIGTGSWRGALGNLRRRRPFVFVAICGLFVASLGAVTGGAVYGSGLEQTQALLEAEAQLPWYFTPAKFAATLAAYFSGLPGGIFAPSLAIGAGVGHTLAPLLDQSAMPGMVLALCMAGFLAAATQAPMTSFLIVMEMVDGYDLVIALMVVSLMSSGISRLISEPLYATLARQMAAAPQVGRAREE